MIKKTICFGVILIICLGLFSGCNQETDFGATLTKYKIEEKTTIEIYAQERQNNYSAENWAIICGIVADGKATIDAAESMDDVDTAVNEVKTAIDAVEEKEDGEDLDTKYDFKDDRVIVILKQKVDGILTPEDFGIDWEKAGLGKITDITRNEDYVGGCPFQKLSIELTVNGIDKILEAIAELEKSEIVQFVEPDYNYIISPPYPYEVEVEPIKEQK